MNVIPSSSVHSFLFPSSITTDSILEYTFREKESHDLLAETIVVIFVEMAHFNKRIEDCVTDDDGAACEIAGFPEDKRIKYEEEMNDEKRLRSEYNTAKRMGLEEGLIKGREEGREEGQ